MNGPKNLSKSLYQKDRPFRAILDFAEKFQIFGILRLPNKFEDLKISSHFILLLNTSSKTICRKKNFGPISVEICCPEKMALKEFLVIYMVYFENSRSRSRGDRRRPRSSEKRSRSPSPRRRKATPPPKKLCVQKLTKNVTKEHVTEIFANFGTVSYCDLVMEKERPWLNMGKAYVEFEKIEEAEEAVTKMDGGFIDGQEIKVAKVLVQRNRSPMPPARNRFGGNF